MEELWKKRRIELKEYKDLGGECFREFFLIQKSKFPKLFKYNLCYYRISKFQNMLMISNLLSFYTDFFLKYIKDFSRLF